MANSAAILTDAFPPDRRGFALGFNQVAALAGQFIGLVAGGLLAAWDWRAVFWVNVPVGVFGTVWAYRRLRDNGERHPGRIDWWGNITFAVGLSAVLIAITAGIQPHGGRPTGWQNPDRAGHSRDRDRAADRVRRHRIPNRGTDDPVEPVQDSRIHRGQHSDAGRRAGPGWPAVHADHLAAGHLAAVARLRLRRHPVVCRALPAAVDGGLPDRGPGVWRAFRPLRCARLSRLPACCCSG